MTTTTTETMFTPLRTPFGIVRQPTAEECELVGRDVFYSQPFDEGGQTDYRALGDYVIESIHNDDPELMRPLATLCECLGMCDEAHVIPAGVYLEE